MDCDNNFFGAEAYDGARGLNLIAEISGFMEGLNSKVKEEDPDNHSLELMEEHLDAAKALYK